MKYFTAITVITLLHVSILLTEIFIVIHGESREKTFCIASKQKITRHGIKKPVECCFNAKDDK